MQVRYTVTQYHPSYAIVRAGDEYRWGQRREHEFLHILKETRKDGRHRWERDGHHRHDFYSVMFDNIEWRVCTISQQFKEPYEEEVLTPGSDLFDAIADAAIDFMVQMTTDRISGRKVK